MRTLSFHAGTEGKVQRNQVKGSLRHTQRKTYGAYVEHGNKDIVKAKTAFNLDYEFQGAPVADVVEDVLERKYKGRRAIRKDAVVIREIIAQPSSEIFIGMSIEQQQEKIAEFVKDAKPWLEKEFGKKNLLGASAHLDEKNPHVHFMVMPLTKDGRLSQKDFFKGPNDFSRQHRQFREHMNKKGWAFDLENKYEGAKGVSLKGLKANGEEIEENRVKLTNQKRESRKLAAELAKKPDIQQEALDLAVQIFLDEPNQQSIVKAIRANAAEKAKAELKKEQDAADKKYFEAAEKMELAEQMIELMQKEQERAPKLPPREELRDILEKETDGNFSVMLLKKSQENVLVDLRGSKPKKITESELIRELTTVEPDGKGGAYLDLEGSAPISYVLGYYSSKTPKTAKQAHWDGLTAITREQKEMALEMENEKTL